MKFACGKRRDERRKRLKEWHLWFAWFPVKVGRHDCRWLEVVSRKRVTYLGVDWYAYSAEENSNG